MVVNYTAHTEMGGEHYSVAIMWERHALLPDYDSGPDFRYGIDVVFEDSYWRFAENESPLNPNLSLSPTLNRTNLNRLSSNHCRYPNPNRRMRIQIQT